MIHRCGVFIFLAIAAQSELAAQTEAREPPRREIVVTATRSVTLTPDHAVLHLTVLTRQPDAARAGEEHSRLARSVRAALGRLGFPAESLPTIGYSVRPEYERDRTRPAAYQAQSTISVRVHDLSLVGRVIDASLAAGANQVTGLRFESTRQNTGRLEALARAVEAAREEARSIAAAAGGRLGGLLQASTGGDVVPMARGVRMQELVAADTPIEPGTLETTATVTTRWEFLPAER